MVHTILQILATVSSPKFITGPLPLFFDTVHCARLFRWLTFFEPKAAGHKTTTLQTALKFTGCNESTKTSET